LNVGLGETICVGMLVGGKVAVDEGVGMGTEDEAELALEKGSRLEMSVEV
jgi:hypothetical protein